MAKKITIDGHSACGKSYISNMIVSELRFAHIDSGLLFRLIAFLRFNKSKSNLGIESFDYFDYFDYFQLNGNLADSSKFDYSILKTEKVGLDASSLGRKREFQEQLIRIQRKVIQTIEDTRKFSGIVLSGRNCGTSVLPNADLKFFLTAPLDVRVDRRFAQLQEMGIITTRELVANQIKKRDRQDSKREFGQLKIPGDSIIMDTSKYEKNELYTAMLRSISNLFGS